MELREKIAAQLCAPYALASYGETRLAELYDKADAILAIPEIRDALLTVEGVKRQGLSLLDDGSVGREYKPRAKA